MKLSSCLSACALAMACIGAAQAQVDLSTLDAHMAGPRAQVLVLGSVHLSQMPKGFKPDSLDPLLAKLEAFKPQVITIEAISGEGCDLLARYPTVYSPENIAPYCNATDDAKAATGLDVPAAIAEAGRTLAAWPSQPTAAQRRHLAALFMAANDPASAATQWLQLPQAERHAGDGIDAKLSARLDAMKTHHNEDYLIAARLAARLGLQRVFAVDDHSGDNISISDEAAFETAIRAAWDAGKARGTPLRERQQALSESGDMLALYRFVNDPATLRTAIDVDFGQAMQDPSPQHFGQLYVAGWETRNLRMVANVRAAFRDQPGARVLSIVGSSHKPWFDSLLSQMQGVDIVDAEQVLGQGTSDADRH